MIPYYQFQDVVTQRKVTTKKLIKAAYFIDVV